MHTVHRARRILVVLLCLLAWSRIGSPQTTTTGTLSGTVVDQTGGVLVGVEVTAVHRPTGTLYTTTTSNDGRFVIQGVRVGGPYTLTARLAGFRERQQTDVVVNLGSDRHLSFQLQLEAVSESLTVTADVGSIINPSQMGTTANVPSEELVHLPTVSRGLEDFARLSPHFNATPEDNGPIRLSVAGRNNRYNNIQIDGAVNNDLFGLAASGTPGGQTEAQPISLDAVQELQLLVAPYDVRQGGFSGGGLNAITRSGSNTIGGTVYWFTRNQDFVGKGIDRVKVGTFDENQFGGSLGGPIRKDRVFFFVNVDITRKSTPSGFSIDGSSGQKFGRESEVNRFLDVLKNQYGYDPGRTAELSRDTSSNKIFARLDFNLSPRHQLTLRHNFITADNDVGYQSSRAYKFPDNFYEIRDRTHSTVAQLNSSFGAFANELRLTYQAIRDRRDGPTRFPFIDVTLSDGSHLQAGRERYSVANALDQDIVELTDDLTWSRGRHLLVFGTHNELFKFDNLYIRDNFGTYEFASLDNFNLGLAQSYDYSFSATANPKQSARFSVRQLGLYLGDTWRVTSRLTLTGGVRIDKPSFPDTPTRNPTSEDSFGYRTDVVPSPTLWSPRVGFNWDLSGMRVPLARVGVHGPNAAGAVWDRASGGQHQLRGGIGLFTGRTPYVWLSNQYGNTGIEFTRISLRYAAANRVPFIADPDGQPQHLPGGRVATNEIDLIDPAYGFPKVLRGNLAYDRELPFGAIATAELLYSKTLADIAYQNINLVPSGQTLPDGRPLFTRKVSTLSDVILLTNTDQGNQWSASLKLERPFRNGWYTALSYLYGRARSVNDGGSSQALSNWRYVLHAGDPNNPPLADSNFDVRHRLTATVSCDLRLFGEVRGVFSLYYNGQTGRPYSTVFTKDINGDGTANDIIYVPKDAGEVVVTGGTWADLDAYIEDDPGLKANRGRIPARNVSRGPWTNSLDLRTAITVPVRGKRIEVTLDVLNLLNLLNRKWGLVEYASFNDITPINYAGVDAATGKMIYDVAPLKSADFRKFDRDDLRSRWQAQLGLRFRF